MEAIVETHDGDGQGAPGRRRSVLRFAFCSDQLISELEHGVPLRNRGRIDGRADVFLDPLGRAS